jgi:hypothetical protein
VAGVRYGGNQLFTEELTRRGPSWVVELPRCAIVASEALGSVVVTELLVSSTWKSHDTISPTTGNIVTYSLAHFGHVVQADRERATLCGPDWSHQWTSPRHDHRTFFGYEYETELLASGRWLGAMD